jgi:hypothetical protein
LVVMNLNNYEVGNITKPSYATLKFLPFVICVYSVASLGFNSSIVVAQVDAGQQIDYARYKTPINGVLMHYVIGGKGDPIVLLHGWPETWYEWRHVIPELIANNFTVIAPDMRGE